MVEVLLAPLAVGPISVLGAVDAVATVAGALVQLLVEVALVGKPVAVACCDQKCGLNIFRTKWIGDGDQ